MSGAPIVDLRSEGVAAEEVAARLQAAADGGAQVVGVLLDGATRVGPGVPNADWYERLPLPLVCGWSGDLTGAASALALACDIRLCDQGASLEVPAAAVARAGRVSGGRLATEGRAGADELLAAGLVSRLVAAGEVESAVTALCATIASRGPIAVRLAKEAVWRGLALPLEAALRFETDLTLLLQSTKDRAEGVRAFMEKRPPAFRGE